MAKYSADISRLYDQIYCRIDFVFSGQTLGNGTFEDNAEAVLNKQIDLSIFGVMKQNTNELAYIQNFMAYKLG